ncbi:MAG: alkaline phosphatase family protein, partial [Candidatus Cybelea sp.]
AIAGAMAVVACSTNTLRQAPDDATTSLTPRVILTGAASPIQHVVFIIQENRSFNNLFLGYPGATTQNYGYDEKGNRIALHAQTLKTHWDLPHSSLSFFINCDSQSGLPGTNCKMDGWNNTHGSIMAPPSAPYAYVPRREIKPYWAMAKQYVLADEMFASNLDASYVSHQYAVAAYASRSVDGPSSYWGCEGGAGDEVQTLTDERALSGDYVKTCMKNPTIGIDADGAGLSWRFYAGDIYGDGGLWSSYQSDDRVYHGPDWKNDVISPPAQVLTDIEAGKLANITWITPTYETSDHAGMWDNLGPAWVASIVDAVGKSKFWKSTAIFVMWDDWGGWFDPVQPVYEDYDGLGFRVPLLVISAYSKQNSVTHVQYETASVLRYIEDNFGLPQLAASDARANDPANDPAVFDYSQSPRKFEKIRGAKSTKYWVQLENATRRRPLPAGVIGDD